MPVNTHRHNRARRRLTAAAMMTAALATSLVAVNSVDAKHVYPAADTSFSTHAKQTERVSFLSTIPVAALETDLGLELDAVTNTTATVSQEAAQREALERGIIQRAQVRESTLVRIHSASPKDDGKVAWAVSVMPPNGEFGVTGKVIHVKL